MPQLTIGARLKRPRPHLYPCHTSPIHLLPCPGSLDLLGINHYSTHLVRMPAAGENVDYASGWDVKQYESIKCYPSSNVPDACMCDR